MRRTRSVCCVWAESGQTTAAPPRIVMNSRRRTASPEAKDKASYRLRLAHRKEPTDVRFGSEAAAQKGMSALPAIATAKVDFRNGHVRFTPESGHVQCS